MAHNKVFGICESKCKVLVPTMEDFDQCYRDIETTAEDTKRLLKASANYAFEEAVTTIYGWSDYVREMALADDSLLVSWNESNKYIGYADFDENFDEVITWKTNSGDIATSGYYLSLDKKPNNTYIVQLLNLTFTEGVLPNSIDTDTLYKLPFNLSFLNEGTYYIKNGDSFEELEINQSQHTFTTDPTNNNFYIYQKGAGTGGYVVTPLEDPIVVSEYLKYNYMASKYRIDIDNLKGVIKVQGQSKFDDSKISTRTTETISFFNGWYTLCPLHRELSRAGLTSDSYKIDNATITMNRVTPFGAAGEQKVFDNQIGNDYGGGFLTYKNNLLLGEKNTHLVGSMSIGLAGEIELRPWSLVQDFCHKVLNHDLINEDDTSIGTLAADDFDAFANAVAGKTFFWEVELPIQKHCPTLI